MIAPFSIRVGQRFIGRGAYAGLALSVIAWDDECDERHGMARVRIESSATAEIERARAAAVNCTHKPTKELHEECLEWLTNPRVEAREFEWFRQWLRHGFIVEVSP